MYTVAVIVAFLKHFTRKLVLLLEVPKYINHHGGLYMYMYFRMVVSSSQTLSTCAMYIHVPFLSVLVSPRLSLQPL